MKYPYKTKTKTLEAIGGLVEPDEVNGEKWPSQTEQDEQRDELVSVAHATRSVCVVFV